MSCGPSRIRYTDQVSTLISAAFAEIYNMKGDIIEILCGKAIFDQLVHMRLALFAGRVDIAAQ